jgi:hypothetical protein
MTLTVAGAAQARGRISASCFPFNFPCVAGFLKFASSRVESTQVQSLYHRGIPPLR